MNGVFELICIFLAFVAIMIIFAALRSIQEDVTEIYSRAFIQSDTLERILRCVTKPELKVSAVTEAYEQGKKDARMWTPTSESRPPIEKPVLVCDFTGYRTAAILKKSDYGMYMWQTRTGMRPYEDIVAWQKLPEPYKEECTGDSCPISYKD